MAGASRTKTSRRPGRLPAKSGAPADFMSSRVDAVREHIAGGDDAAAPVCRRSSRRPPICSGTAWRAEAGAHPALLAAFVGLGFGVEALFSRATGGSASISTSIRSRPSGDRARLVAERAAFAFGLVVAFALGSIGAFLAFHWPPLLREILFGYLIVFLAIRMAAVLGRFLLAPYNERFRVSRCPRRRRGIGICGCAWCVGWLMFGLVTQRGPRRPRHLADGRDLVGYGFGLGTLAILMEALWRRPAASDDAPVAEASSTEGGRESRHLSRIKVNVLLTAALVVLWSLRVAAAMPAFWLLAVLIVWPLADRLTRRAVEHLLRPPGTTEIAGMPTLTTVFLERGLRAALIIGALALLAWGWGIDLRELAGRGTMATRIAHGVLSAVAIALIADFIWHVAKAAIDRKLAETRRSRPAEHRRSAAAGAAAHPVADLSQYPVRRRLRGRGDDGAGGDGVEIGPLIAGLSVLGVAIGFGAQSFVRDIIAGMFYLLDDAFRVGEYIQSGNYKGTVEGFSFRSVRLRHQRGPIYTVPFGLLGAVAEHEPRLGHRQAHGRHHL